MSDKIKDGGPAFPFYKGGYAYCSAMTLRDWFAGQFANGLMSSTAAIACIGEAYNQDPKLTGEHIARRSYQLADEMISAREK